MRLCYAVIARFAEVNADKTLTLRGGDVERLSTDVLPLTQQSLALVIKLTAQQEADLGEHTLQVTLTDPQEAQVMPEIQQLIMLAAEDDMTSLGTVGLVLNFEGLRFTMPGKYNFHISVDGAKLGTVPLFVIYQEAHAEERAS